MEKLFDIPEEEKPKGETCRNCVYKYNHYYGKMIYCELQKDPRTSYGNKKIKAGDPACPQFKKNKP